MGADMLNRAGNSKGFTLIELIIVIILIGIIAAAITPLIGNKFSAVAQSTKRAAWVGQAEYALFHLKKDLAFSVPNSIFTSEPISGNHQVVEFLSGSADSGLFVARYRNRQLSGQNRLQPNNDNSFDLFGSYLQAPAWVSIGLTSASEARTDWEAGSTSGRFASVASVTSGTGENGSPVSTVTLNSSHNFGAHSPYFRAYFFDGPIGYQCDTNNNFLYRVRDYTSLATGSDFTSRSASGIKDRIINDLRSCEFSLTPGLLYAPPSLKVRLEIGDGNESVVISEIIVLRNAP